MNQVVVFVTFLVTSAMVQAKSEPDPSTLQGMLNDEYYLGSGADRPLSSVYNRGKELEFTEEENKIVQDVFSPDYYEPNIILDYRYLKSGGRGYARSDGGQILILPKRVQMPTLYNNYDTLIEFYRLKHQQEMGKYWKMEENRSYNEHENLNEEELYKAAKK